MRDRNGWPALCACWGPIIVKGELRWVRCEREALHPGIHAFLMPSREWFCWHAPEFVDTRWFDYVVQPERRHEEELREASSPDLPMRIGTSPRRPPEPAWHPRDWDGRRPARKFAHNIYVAPHSGVSLSWSILGHEIDRLPTLDEQEAMLA